jgi:hypothetical protein
MCGARRRICFAEPIVIVDDSTTFAAATTETPLVEHIILESGRDVDKSAFCEEDVQAMAVAPTSEEILAPNDATVELESMAMDEDEEKAATAAESATVATSSASTASSIGFLPLNDDDADVAATAETTSTATIVGHVVIAPISIVLAGSSMMDNETLAPVANVTVEDTLLELIPEERLLEDDAFTVAEYFADDLAVAAVTSTSPVETSIAPNAATTATGSAPSEDDDGLGSERKRARQTDMMK